MNPNTELLKLNNCQTLATTQRIVRTGRGEEEMRVVSTVG